MTEQKIWCEDLQKLLKVGRDNSFVYLSDIEGMLSQMDVLLMQAIDKLGTNVVQIGQDVHHLRDITNQLEKNEINSKEVMKQMNTLGQEIDEKVAEVVTAMQFQDMTSQLIYKILSRVKGVQEIMDRVDKFFIDLSQAEGQGDMQMMAREIVANIEERCKEIEVASDPQISQKHLEEGSVDLF